MKAVSLGLAVTLLFAPQEDDAAKKALRIDRALGWLANEEVDVREMGRKELLQIGPDAVPAIEKRVAEKGATELVQLLRHFDRAPGIAETWVSEKELQELEADDQFRKEAEHDRFVPVLQVDSLDQIVVSQPDGSEYET